MIETKFDMPSPSGTPWENIRPVMIFADYGGSDLYACFAESGYEPSVFLVAGDSWQDAYDNFLVIPRVVEEIGVKDFELGDYDPETVKYNDDGVMIDDESCMCYGPVQVSWFGYEDEQGPDPD